MDHLETSSQPNLGLNPEKKYWASLAQYNDDPEFLKQAHKEFASSPLQEEAGKENSEGGSEGGFNRRDFMKLMAASSALASTACFQKPAHKILPYVNQPEEVTFGIPNFYASTCGECSTGCGTLVKTREGRPIKIEGNPDHPVNKGGLCARGQASILNLYDPDRLRNPVIMTRGSLKNEPAKWDNVDKQIAGKLQALKPGGRVRILSGTLASPSTQALINDFLKGFSHGSHVVYDPISAEQVVQAQELSYGTKVLPRYRLDRADVIVTIDADILGTWISPVEFTKQFSQNRKLSKKTKQMNKLVTFESVMTITGTNADVRVPIRPQDGAAVALALAYELSQTMKVVTLPAEAADIVKGFSPETVAQSLGFDVAILKKTAQDLWSARGKSLVMAGSVQSQSENGLSLQLAVNLLNSALQNDGVTVDYASSPSNQSSGSYAALTALIKEMKAGEVDALFIYKSNPVYSLPATLGFVEAAKNVKLVVNFSDRIDESGVVSDFVLPDNHALESWGDAEPQKNVFSLVQPTIRSIYDTRSFQDSLLAFSKAGLNIGSLSQVHDFHEYVQTHWKNTVYKDSGSIAGFDLFWESALRDGVVDIAGRKGSKDSKSSSRAFKGAALKAHAPIANKVSGENFSLAFYSNVALHDGTGANNAWLQELPDPVSRVAWDNFLSVSAKTAKDMNLADGDMVKVKLADKTLDLPAFVQPGLHPEVVAVAIGYGRDQVGAVGNGIGQNMFPHITVSDSGPVFSGFPVTVKKTGAKYMLASVQEHSSIEARPIVHEASYSEFKENPRAGNEEKEELTTIWKSHEYKGYRWGMAIDLTTCTGCNACVIGCQSENNVPVVGKDGVYRGRSMHWIRIDRYYSGTPDNPKVVHQPMLCQHCENAPCETVCPVLATVHDDEGLNSQIYNRCVGTRYCANNCPYKVRRFNWFDYNYGGQIRYPLNLSQNPEVTVRSRGVMEKCTFCVQRIADAKNNAKNLGRTVQDGEMKTACQQSCPADAITFGNINDKDSEVFKLAQDPRGFHVLGELNTRPSITYLTKITNGEALS